MILWHVDDLKISHEYYSVIRNINKSQQRVWKGGTFKSHQIPGK